MGFVAVSMVLAAHGADRHIAVGVQPALGNMRGCGGRWRRDSSLQAQGRRRTINTRVAAIRTAACAWAGVSGCMRSALSAPHIT